MKKETKFILYKESLFQSVIADTYSFGLIVGSVWFNYQFINNSNFLNVILLFIILLWIFSKSNSKRYAFYSKEELQKYIDKL